MRVLSSSSASCSQVLMRKLMQCDDPSTGVDRVHLWIILLKVLASDACPHTHAMLLEHTVTVSLTSATGYLFGRIEG